MYETLEENEYSYFCSSINNNNKYDVSLGVCDKYNHVAGERSNVVIVAVFYRHITL